MHYIIPGKKEILSKEKILKSKGIWEHMENGTEFY